MAETENGIPVEKVFIYGWQDDVFVRKPLENITKPQSLVQLCSPIIEARKRGGEHKIQILLSLSRTKIGQELLDRLT